MKTQPSAGRRLAALLLLAAASAASGKVPEPDKLIYGTVTTGGCAVTALDTQYVVEVRTAPDAPPLQRYAMGSSTNYHPYFYGLRVTLEAFAERQDADALIGDTLTLVLYNGADEVARTNCVVAARGPSRVDFGGPADSDRDGLEDLDELEPWRTDPRDPDTDGDGLSDGDEVNRYHTNPTLRDTDGDGQSDGDEVALGTDPNDDTSFGVLIRGETAYSGGQTSGLFRLAAVPWDGAEEVAESNAAAFAEQTEPGPYTLGPVANGRGYAVFAYRDSNGSGLVDSWEAFGLYSNAPVHATGDLAAIDIALADPDTDGDGVPDYRELFEFGTDPEDTDSDNDGIEDGDELGLGTDPADPDSDNDGVLDGLESLLSTDPLDPDSDGDGLPDGYEADSDGDGLVDYREMYEFRTDPRLPDTDGDGLSDGDEIDVYRTRPLRPDSDGDGLSDGREVGLRTNPNLPDTDGDGVADGLEVDTYHSDPLKTDTDGDGLADGREVKLGTDPTKKDTDDDGLGDREEIKTHGTDPLKPDTDGDGLSDGAEVRVHGTDPLKTDTDQDKLSDGAEVKTWRTNPLNRDTDADGLWDSREVLVLGTDPNSIDTDADGLTDGAEVKAHHTNPTLADTDRDGIRDGRELNRLGTNPLVPDTDGDELLDGDELAAGTLPLVPDTDGDELKDGLEVNYYGTDPLDPRSRLASIRGAVAFDGAPTGRLHIVASRWPSRVLRLNGGADGLAVTGLVYGASGAVGDLTVEGWLLTTARGTNAVISFGRDKLWKLSVGNDRDGGYTGLLAFDTTDSAGNTHYLKGAKRVNDGQWHHFAATFCHETGDKILYVDGLPDAAAPAAHGPLSSLGRFDPGERRHCLIGRGWDPGDTAFEGLLDEIRLWKRVLPAREVKRLPAFQPAERRTDLLANWHFDDGTGADATAAARPGRFLGRARTINARTVWGGLAQAVSETRQRFPGVYAVTNLPTLRSYYVFAYLDANKSKTREYWESFGAATSSVYLAEDVAEVRLRLLESPITTPPTEGDLDGDGKTDAEEIFRYGTDPRVFD